MIWDKRARQTRLGILAILRLDLIIKILSIEVIIKLKETKGKEILNHSLMKFFIRVIECMGNNTRLKQILIYNQVQNLIKRKSVYLKLNRQISIIIKEELAPSIFRIKPPRLLQMITKHNPGAQIKGPD